MLGPVWLIPAAMAGVISLALLKRRKFLPLYLTFASLLLPLASRCPIGRYRLMLIPLFVWFAAAFINELVDNKEKRLALLAILIGVFGCNLLDTPFERPNPAAHHTYALACIKTNNKAEAKKELKTSWEISQFTYAPSGLLLVLQHLNDKDFATAESIILQNRSSAVHFQYYLALIRTSQNRLQEALELLDAMQDTRSLGELYPKYLKLREFLTLQLAKTAKNN